MKPYEPRSAREMVVARHSRPRTRRRLPPTDCLELRAPRISPESITARMQIARGYGANRRTRITPPDV